MVMRGKMKTLATSLYLFQSERYRTSCECPRTQQRARGKQVGSRGLDGVRPKKKMLMQKAVAG